MKAHLSLKDWDALYKLLPTIKNNRKIPQQECQSAEHQTLVNLLNSQTGQPLSSLWKSLDKKQKLNPEYLTPYASQLIKSAESDDAEEPLVKVLNTQFDPLLLALYCQLDIDSNKKTKQLNKWLNNYKDNTHLLNATAQFYLTQSEPDKAKELLEQSLAITASSDALFLLGQTYEQHAEGKEKAYECFRKGLELSLNPTAGSLQ